MTETWITRDRLYLALIMCLAGFLNAYAIWDEGYSNNYYSAAVKSMLTSFHNFFFNSFDAGGFVTVDKPPLGLWIQALSATVFGFQGWSLILPQVLATLISTAIIYHLVSRKFGNPAGLISALVFTLTPIVVAISRTNNLDAILVLLLLVAAWALMLAVERGSLRLLLLSVTMVGLGFNVKMLQAFGIVPAIFVIYLLSSAIKPSRRIVHLSIAVVALLTVSLSWALVVDLTPADQRPYVGGSETNSVIELALGYNGLQRILPGGTAMGVGPLPADARGGQSGGNSPAFAGPGGTGEMSSSIRQSTPPGGMGAGPGNEGGSAGVFRLFNQQMAGQISWLLPLAIIGFFSSVLILNKLTDPTKNDKLRSLGFWFLWMLPMLVYFSIAGFFHRYYLITLAPAIAALCGIGVTQMWEEYRSRGKYSLFLPVALISTVATEACILARYPGYNVLLLPPVCMISVTSAAMLILARIDSENVLNRALKSLAAIGLAALLIAPALWSLTPIIYGTQAVIPYAGPELSYGMNMPGVNASNRDAGSGFAMMFGGTSTSGLVNYLLDNTENERFLVAVPSSMSATEIILETGKPVMAVGGFGGGDRILTVEKLEQMVADGEIRYYLNMGMPGSFTGMPGQAIADNSTGPSRESGFTGMPGNGQAEIVEWVTEHGTVVPESEWMDTDTLETIDRTGMPRMENGFTLYDLKEGV